MKKILSHEIFYTHAVTDVTDNYEVCLLKGPFLHPSHTFESLLLTNTLHHDVGDDDDSSEILSAASLLPPPSNCRTYLGWQRILVQRSCSAH